MNRADSGKDSTNGAQAPLPAKARKTTRKIPPRTDTAASDRSPIADVSESAPDSVQPASELSSAAFRRRLSAWYRRHARPLPWRATSDPYRIWVSEVMLQQTRVAAVVDHYNEFLRRFPSLVSLALAPESDVLAAWSGLGYYRRARMLHKAAQFIVLERDGRLPTSSIELRTLPGIGEYTAAAIASIAFGESVAVVDGNVERVLLRIAGSPQDSAASTSARVRAFIRAQAQALIPHTHTHQSDKLGAPFMQSHRMSGMEPTTPNRLRPAGVWDAEERIAIAASAHPASPAGEADDGPDTAAHAAATNAAGDHNQAMMELGATICLPRAPLCLQCPVYVLCRTRGEHPTQPRAPQLSRPVAYLLDLRKRGSATEVLLERRPNEASLMPSMYELPPLPLDAVEGREPVLRVRHSITSTNYYVQVFAPRRVEPDSSAKRARSEAQTLRRAIPADARDLHWVRTSRLATLPLTGLARKILHRLKVMDSPHLNLLD